MNEYAIRRKYWDDIYKKKAVNETSWHEEYPSASIKLIKEFSPDITLPIVDIGGGASMLVDELLKLGYSDITVVDTSEIALDAAEARLGDLADKVHWSLQDAAGFISGRKFHIWHDRLTFHFLLDTQEIFKYCKKVDDYLLSGGYVLLCTFSKDGPEMCSGLRVSRYSEKMIEETFGRDYALLRSFTEDHITPLGAKQILLWSVLRKIK